MSAHRADIQRILELMREKKKPSWKPNMHIPRCFGTNVTASKEKMEVVEDER